LKKRLSIPSTHICQTETKTASTPKTHSKNLNICPPDDDESKKFFQIIKQGGRGEQYNFGKEFISLILQYD